MERSRDRVLSIYELRHIYRTAQLMGRWRGLLRVLILTGQRRGEVSAIKPRDIEGNLWSITNTKNRKPHLVHLVPAALRELERAKVGRGYVWSDYHGFSYMMLKLQGMVKIEDWRVHDFRRSFATHLCEAGEIETVVDRILNHTASGSASSAVARVYNRSSLLDARQAAMMKYHDILFPKKSSGG